MSKVMMVGECLVGDGNEVAHIDLLIGPKDGPVGQAFAASLVNQTDGFTSLLSLVTPNLPAKPDTIMTNKVTIKGADQAVQMFGPAQAAVARARDSRPPARHRLAGRTAAFARSHGPYPFPFMDRFMDRLRILVHARPLGQFTIPHDSSW